MLLFKFILSTFLLLSSFASSSSNNNSNNNLHNGPEEYERMAAMLEDVVRARRVSLQTLPDEKSDDESWSDSADD